MSSDGTGNRLSRISTAWSLLQQAHGGETQAQFQMMHRYHGAVYRYFLGAVRDEDVALELFQEFALRFLQGRLRHAHPDLGRFRDYLKVTLCHLVSDYHRERRRCRPLAPDTPASEPPTDDDHFLQSWRDELLAQAWAALASDYPTYHCALLSQTERPDQSSDELAAHLTDRLRKPTTGASARVTLHRARQKFAVLLVDEVRRSLLYPSAEELEHELNELGLHGLCRVAETPD